MPDTPEIQAKPIPLGAKILRKLYGGLRSLCDEATKMAAEMDDGPAKDSVGGHVGTLTGTVGEMGKGWSKLYKDLEIDEAAAEEAEADEPSTDEAASEDTPDDATIDAALDSLDDLRPEEETEKPKVEPDAKPDAKAVKVAAKADDSPDDEDDMDDGEKAFVIDHINKLETQIKHLERLQRVATTRA